MDRDRIALFDKFSGKKLATFPSLQEAYKYTFTALKDVTAKICNSPEVLKSEVMSSPKAAVTRLVASNAALRNLRLYDDPGLVVVDLRHGVPRKDEGSVTCGCGEPH